MYPTREKGVLKRPTHEGLEIDRRRTNKLFEGPYISKLMFPFIIIKATVSIGSKARLGRQEIRSERQREDEKEKHEFRKDFRLLPFEAGC